MISDSPFLLLSVCRQGYDSKLTGILSPVSLLSVNASCPPEANTRCTRHAEAEQEQRHLFTGQE